MSFQREAALVLQPLLVPVVTSLADTKRGGERLARICEGKLNIVSSRSDEMSSLPPSLSPSLPPSVSSHSSDPSGRAGDRVNADGPTV